MENNKPQIQRVIQRCGCDFILPFALVYLIYIILHGHLSPGGGFQGGVLMVGVVLLVYLGHGYEVTCRAFSYNLLHAVGAQFAQNILYTHGDVGQLYSSGTIFWMNVTVGVKVLTGIGSISLIMLGVLKHKDVDYYTKEEVK